MGRLFGTDGVRGLVSKELTISLAMKIGASTVKVLKNNDKKLTFLVGCDTRLSKDVLKSALVAGVLSEDADIIDLGVIPTPAVSYLITKYHADGGFVISASHNPSEYNGIKVFNSEGFKLADELEDKIEDVITNSFELSSDTNKVGKYILKEDAKDDYVNYLKNTIDVNLSNLHIAVDAANGASFETAEMLFKALNVNYEIINNNPDGLNINDNCGSTHIEGLQKLVKDNHLDAGVAFDGDADRCLMVSEKGELIDGDKILAIYINYLKKQGKLKNNTVVGTVMSNMGLNKYCEKEGINFEATKVGDRYVLENMLQNDYVIGGEQSGHIIFKELANTGDGELTSIQILMVMVKENSSLSELSNIMEEYPQVLKNVIVSKDKKETFKENDNINKCIKNVEERLNKEGRVLVRASGTENLIRVMLVGKNLEVITNMCDEIVSVIEKELK